MKIGILSLAALMLAGSTAIVAAQGAGDTPTSAVPPSGPSHHSVSTNTTDRTPAGMTPGASKEGYAHNTGNVANGPTPPRQTGSQPPTTPRTGAASTTIVPGPAYNAGTANVGNSSANNGVGGSAGAAASATMQNGHAATQ
jgi:hypothetical protein